jgi:hypothetical protein
MVIFVLAAALVFATAYHFAESSPREHSTPEEERAGPVPLGLEVLAVILAMLPL